MKQRIALFLLAIAPCGLEAQRVQPPAHFARVGLASAAVARQDTARMPGALRPIRLAKWTLLATAATTGIYGFVQNDRADDRYRELEMLCQAEPVRCEDRTPGGAYNDPEFESRFQAIRGLDRRSHYALLASQLSVATGVVLFLLDLGNVRGPADKPYTPPRVRVGPDDAGRFTIELRLPAGPTPPGTTRLPAR